jgi:hypothetical protein
MTGIIVDLVEGRTHCEVEAFDPPDVLTVAPDDLARCGDPLRGPWDQGRSPGRAVTPPPAGRVRPRTPASPPKTPAACPRHASCGLTTKMHPDRRKAAADRAAGARTVARMPAGSLRRRGGARSAPPTGRAAPGGGPRRLVIRAAPAPLAPASRAAPADFASRAAEPAWTARTPRAGRPNAATPFRRRGTRPYGVR